MKKYLFILAVLVPALAITASFSFGDDPAFSDLKNDHWAYGNVIRLAKEGIITGYPDGSFKPKNEVTYAEFIKMVAVAGRAIEGDVKSESGYHWAMPYYETSINNAYFTKWDISQSALDRPIPRKDMALIASGIIGEGIKVSDYGDYNKILGSISDVNVRDTHEFYIVKAYATGILSGYPDGSFKPDGVLSRAEAASVIDRLIKAINGEGVVVELQVPEEKPEENLKNEEPEDQGLIIEEPKIKYGGSLRDDYYDLVAVEENPLGAPDGTVDFRMFEYSYKTDERQAELLRVLEIYYPAQAEEIHKTLITFAAKPMPDGKQGMRKQYFGDYPVLMEHMKDVVGLYVLPIGYTDYYYGIKPGQIYEEFF